MNKKLLKGAALASFTCLMMGTHLAAGEPSVREVDVTRMTCGAAKSDLGLLKKSLQDSINTLGAKTLKINGIAAWFDRNDTTRATISNSELEVSPAAEDPMDLKHQLAPLQGLQGISKLYIHGTSMYELLNQFLTATPGISVVTITNDMGYTIAIADKLKDFPATVKTIRLRASLSAAQETALSAFFNIQKVAEKARPSSSAAESMAILTRK